MRKDGRKNDRIYVNQGPSPKTMYKGVCPMKEVERMKPNGNFQIVGSDSQVQKPMIDIADGNDEKI